MIVNLGFLLTEDGYYLLQEDSNKIIVEPIQATAVAFDDISMEETMEQIFLKYARDPTRRRGRDIYNMKA